MFSELQRGTGRAAGVAVDRSAALTRAFACSFCLIAVLLAAATLERASLEELSEQATDVVYGQVLGANVAMRGDSVYTHYSVQVRERWKGNAQSVMDVVLPGGTAGNIHQSFAGVPKLEIGKNYVMFLWTGPSSRTQLVGLTQGLFEVSENTAGDLVAARSVSSELMLDHTGKPVQDTAVSMLFHDLGSRVKTSLAKGKSVR